jgi:hypothetical protein
MLKYSSLLSFLILFACSGKKNVDINDIERKATFVKIVQFLKTEQNRFDKNTSLV